MNRKTILQAVEQVATAKGYTFYSDTEELARSTVKALPAVWLSPPKFISMQGRKHGKITYEVTLHALCDGVKCASAARNQSWTQMEQELVDMFSMLSQNETVALVKNLAIRNTTNTLAGYGEVVATATAEVVTLF